MRAVQLLAALALGSLIAAPGLAQCNSVPIATNDFVAYFGQAITVEVLLNDNEPDGEALTLSITGNNCSSPSAGSPLSVSVANGTLRLVPAQPRYSSNCTVSYRIEDEHGFTASAQVFISDSIFADGFELGNASRWTVVTSGSGVEP